MVLDEADRLYDLPLESFTEARNALAAELKRAGRADEAEAVRALRKPSVAAWAANQVARRHRGELGGFLEAAERLRKAQLGEGDVREATRAERAALERLLHLAGEYAGDAQLVRVRQTLEAAAADEAAAELLRGGRLERELEPAGFGTLVAGTPPPAPPRRRRAPDPALKRAVAAARARVAELRREVRTAEDEARRRHAEWQRASEAADEAAERLADAERELAEAEACLEDA
jgi:hypothetical protein